MKRFMRVLTIASMSSVYLMQVPCTSDDGGFSLIPQVPSLTTFLQGLPIIGGLIT